MHKVRNSITSSRAIARATQLVKTKEDKTKTYRSNYNTS
jgi:hypothetical protein